MRHRNRRKKLFEKAVGAEDPNHNGMVDADESDPLNGEDTLTILDQDGDGLTDGVAAKSLGKEMSREAEGQEKGHGEAKISQTT